DVNFDGQTIAQPAVFPESGIDALIIETTRGDNATPPNFTRAAEEKRFAEVIIGAFERGGCVLVPVFALGKTQEILAMIYRLRREKILGEFPLYIGGLSTKMTEIYDRFSLTSRRNFPRLQLLQDIEPFTLNADTIVDAPAKPGRIYALSSGMMTPKTLSNIFARRVLEDPKHSIFFVGYADPESPAGVLREAKSGDLITLDPDLPPQTLRCQVEKFQFSAHATRESIVTYVKKLAPKKVVLVHGDLPAIEWVRAQLAKELPGTEVIVPPPGVEIEL
ncbi:MAG: MBL fold metallo-hydrolase, partial [Verrucomicrobiota bacterium]|nr:MBL fold metallo-hydrolase [Verrucomicrobiota bacterium]